MYLTSDPLLCDRTMPPLAAVLGLALMAAVNAVPTLHRSYDLKQPSPKDGHHDCVTNKMTEVMGHVARESSELWRHMLKNRTVTCNDGSSAGYVRLLNYRVGGGMQLDHQLLSTGEACWAQYQLEFPPLQRHSKTSAS